MSDDPFRNFAVFMVILINLIGIIMLATVSARHLWDNYSILILSLFNLTLLILLDMFSYYVLYVKKPEVSNDVVPIMTV